MHVGNQVLALSERHLQYLTEYEKHAVMMLQKLDNVTKTIRVW